MGAPELSAVGALAHEGDEARFLAALCAPADRRERLFALIAFNLELAKIPASVSEPMLGEIRLAWWREALEDLFERGAVRGHDVIAALAAAHRAAPLHRETLEVMISARAYALEPSRPDDREGLARFIAGTGGALMAAEVRALGGDDRAAEVAALAGWAEGAGRLIEALPGIVAAGGTAPLASGVDLKALREGRGADALGASLRELAQEGIKRLEEARGRAGDIPRAMRAPLLSVHMVEPILKAAAAPGFDPFSETGRSPFRARLALLGRAMAGRF